MLTRDKMFFFPLTYLLLLLLLICVSSGLYLHLDIDSLSVTAARFI